MKTISTKSLTDYGVGQYYLNVETTINLIGSLGEPVAQHVVHMAQPILQVATEAAMNSDCDWLGHCLGGCCCPG